MKVEPQQLKAFLLDAGLIKESDFEECFKKAEETKPAVLENPQEVYFKRLEERFNALENKLTKTTETKEAVSYQNGRTRLLEDWTNQSKIIIEKNSSDINSLKNYRWYILGFFFAISISGWFALQYIVSKSVENFFVSNVTKIEYEK